VIQLIAREVSVLLPKYAKEKFSGRRSPVNFRKLPQLSAWDVLIA
jgi:hypothetical protein